MRAHGDREGGTRAAARTGTGRHAFLPGVLLRRNVRRGRVALAVLLALGILSGCATTSTSNEQVGIDAERRNLKHWQRTKHTVLTEARSSIHAVHAVSPAIRGTKVPFPNHQRGRIIAAFSRNAERSTWPSTTKSCS